MNLNKLVGKSLHLLGNFNSSNQIDVKVSNIIKYLNRVIFLEW